MISSLHGTFKERNKAGDVSPIPPQNHLGFIYVFTDSFFFFFARLCERSEYRSSSFASHPSFPSHMLPFAGSFVLPLILAILFLSGVAAGISFFILLVTVCTCKAGLGTAREQRVR